MTANPGPATHHLSSVRDGRVVAVPAGPTGRASRLPGQYGRVRRRGTGRSGGRDDSDRGSATLWLLVVGLALVIFSLGGAAIGAARVARHQARVAADLGALAGAARALEGPESACAQATVVAAANSARVTSCTLDGFDLQITAEVKVEPLPGLTRNARATSRAGPVRG